MTAEAFSFTVTVVGTKADALVHDSINPHIGDAVQNMHYVDAAYVAAGMSPR